MWTLSCWYFLALQARNREGELVIASPVGNGYETETTEGFSEAGDGEFEVRPAVSLCKALTSHGEGLSARLR